MTSTQRWPLVVKVLATASLLAVLAGCATPRAALGTQPSPCFTALPAARAAVANQGKFAGVTLTNVPARLGVPRFGRRRATTTTSPPSATAGPTTTVPRRGVCLVAFHGTFDIGRIPLWQGPNQTGSYAVAVVGVHSHRALLVYLTDRLPRAFKHL